MRPPPLPPPPAAKKKADDEAAAAASAASAAAAKKKADDEVAAAAAAKTIMDTALRRIVECTSPSSIVGRHRTTACILVERESRGAPLLSYVSRTRIGYCGGK